MKYLMLVAVLLATPAQAQRVVDRSGKAIPQQDVEKITSMVGKHLRDPLSAQIRSLRIFEDDRPTYCGEVNAKALSGGYAGFQPFFVVVTSGGLFFGGEDQGQFVPSAQFITKLPWC